MATGYGVKEKNSTQPEVGQGFGGNDKMKEPAARMDEKGDFKGPKSTNHREHDAMMHKMMPAGYKEDCGY